MRTIVSLPEGRRSGLNQIFLKAGRFPENGSEVIISEPFAQARSLRLGNSDRSNHPRCAKAPESRGDRTFTRECFRDTTG